MNKVDMTTFEPPEDLAGLNVPVYLYQWIDGNNWLIHREVSRSEWQVVDTIPMFRFEGRWYRYSVADATSETAARRVIQRFWDDIQELSEKKDLLN